MPGIAGLLITDVIVAAAGAGVSPGTILAVLGALLGGSGLVGWVTVKRTNESLSVKASSDAVDAVDKALNRIEKELARSKAEVTLLEDRMREQSDRHQRELAETAKVAADERGAMQDRIEQLNDRIKYLEDVVERYRRRAEDRGEAPADYGGPERRGGEPPDA